MKWSIFSFPLFTSALFTTLLATTSYAGGLFSEGYEGYLPTPQYQTVAMPPDAYTAGYGYGGGGGYDPFGPRIYSPWNSSRCYNCTGVWAGYGCHEFKGSTHGGGGCGGKCGAKGCRHGHAHNAGACTAQGCTAAEDATLESAPIETAPVESAQPEKAAEPVGPPVPGNEKSASLTIARQHG